MKKIFLLLIAAACSVAVYSQSLDYEQGNAPVTSHEYVDLGLPSGTLWATMNIGATAPEEYGDYFAWGEVTPKESYTWTTYKWCNGNWDSMTKYGVKSSFGVVDNKTELDPEDDAATMNWGSEWCMPTRAQQDELRNNCTSEWTTINGVKGCLLTSNINQASLFLPFAGNRWDTTLYNAGSSGFYWSRNLKTTGAGSHSLFVSSNSMSTTDYSRGYGLSVRAVRAPEGWGPQLLKGDVNGDGEVDVRDITALIDVIMNSVTDNPRADVSEDGEIDVRDITALIDIIMNN
ncbi:MAG: dockerin type I repeat-containing protein [Muribaculaceae bacterium]|nr:dockerin type I repeat-containing protein [Muribaculaceae bacterium]